jgi:cytochrome o ubiquinol oxidase subunit 2
VQVVALDWKWLFIYPDQHLATVNELDVPVGRPIHLDLTSATVMQSLLLPQLAGQIYAMAGMSTQLNFRADRPGRFRGENTQYDGAGFQDQGFAVLARPPGDFQTWARHVRRSAPPFTDSVYQALLSRSVEPAPRMFSAPPPGLYRRMLTEASAGSRAGPPAESR